MDRPSQLHGESQKRHGQAEEAASKISGSTKLFMEGKMDQVAGQTESSAAGAGQYLGGMKDQVVGGAKEMWGKATGNLETQAKGEVQQAVGEAKKEMSKLSGGASKPI